MTLAMTVLAYEGVQSRVYLEALRRAGQTPRRVILMLNTDHPETGEPVLPWLPGGLRGIWIKLLQEAAQLYWPRTLARTRPGLVEAVLEGASAIEPAAREVFRKVTAPAFPWASYGASFETVLCKNYKDAALRERLEALGRSEPGAVLFTGGGLLPRSLLALEGLRFLHVHPGALPDVRGADGLLWSLLLRGRPGASAFYMAPGIDEGDLIAVREFDPPRLSSAGWSGGSTQDVYRALFSCYDPLMRARVLVDGVLSAGEDPAALPATPQDPKAGRTFHFMEEGLRGVVFERLFSAPVRR